MRPRSLLVCLFLLAFPLLAQAQRVVLGNAELIRERRATGIHTAGAEQVARYLESSGATVRRVRVSDVRPGSRARLDLAKLGRADLVAISATMRESRRTVSQLVRDLKRHGVAGHSIVVGGRALSRPQAAKLGVKWAPGPGRALDEILRDALPRQTKTAKE